MFECEWLWRRVVVALGGGACGTGGANDSGPAVRSSWVGLSSASDSLTAGVPAVAVALPARGATAAENLRKECCDAGCSLVKKAWNLTSVQS